MDATIERSLDEQASRIAALDARLTRLEGLAEQSGAFEPRSSPALETRLHALEVRLAMEAHDETVDPGAEAAGPIAYADWFVRVTVVCFVLVGALLLRMAAQGGLIGPTAGTALGLGYCALLLTTPFVAPTLPRLGKHVLVLELSGALLAPLVVLETYHKSRVLSLPWAIALAAVVALVAGALGALRGERLLANAALGVGVATLFALGLAPDALGWRTGATAMLVAAALVVADRRTWPELRLVTVGPVLVAGGLGPMVLARKPDVPADTLAILALSGAAVLVLVAASHLIRRARLERSEAAWLPVTALWALALGVNALGTPALVTGALAGAIALGLSAIAHWRGSTARLAATSAVATGGLLALASVPWLSPSGLGAGVVAIMVFLLASGLANPWLAALSELLALAAVVPTLRQVAATSAEGMGLVAASAGLVVTVLLVHYGLARRAAPALTNESDEAVVGPLLARALSPASLAIAVVGLFAALRAAALALLGPGSALDFAQTVIIATLAVAALRLGADKRRRDLRNAGLVGVAVLAAKVLLHDLPTLEGGPKVAAVIILGLVSLIVSLSLSRSSASKTQTSSPASVRDKIA
jgi:hypothetical protein